MVFTFYLEFLSRYEVDPLGVLGLQGPEGLEAFLVGQAYHKGGSFTFIEMSPRTDCSGNN